MTASVYKSSKRAIRRSRRAARETEILRSTIGASAFSMPLVAATV